MAAKAHRPRICKSCKRETDRSAFYDANGAPNPRGRFCRDCHETAELEDARATIANAESATRKSRIIFGKWWRHYAAPDAFTFYLYHERNICPYCGIRLPRLSVYKSSGPPHFDRPHLDHMDPLTRGGEDSIRNAVYCCGTCNYAKGRRLFTAWLASLAPEYQELSRRLYIEKHGHTPEEFVPGERQARSGGGIELPCGTLIDTAEKMSKTEDELLREYPTPTVSGPPRDYLVRFFGGKPPEPDQEIIITVSDQQVDAIISRFKKKNRRK